MKMERRSFIKISALASGSLMIPGFLRAFQGMPGQAVQGMKRLVVIQLSGGNDGLSTVVPLANDVYLSSRKSTRIDGAEKIAADTGLHPSLKGVRRLFDNAEMALIHAVGYPNPDRSHFRSLDIWHTASRSDQYLSTGWLGRFLDAHCASPHHVLEVDDSLSLALRGTEMNGMAVRDIRLLHQLTREPFFASLNELVPKDGPSNLDFLYKTVTETYASSGTLYDAHSKQDAKAEYPGSQFGKGLREIASLMISGLDTRVFYVSLTGFDTHVSQIGTHNKLMEEFDQGLSALVSDLKAHDLFKDTAIMVFSEFGRRVKENASGGTDHGAAGPVMVFSGGLKKPGMYNAAPDLTDLDEQGDIVHQIDFKRIYASLLSEWMQGNAQGIVGPYEPLGLF